MALLTVRGLTVAYGASPVLIDFDLDLDTGETVTLLGANGAGKSTALKAIAGLMQPREGDICFGGDTNSYSGGPERLAKLGLVFIPESRGIFRALTVGQHVQLLASEGARPGWKRLIGWFPELEPLRGRRAAVLSGGEQQMLSIGCAMLRWPKVLMIDELSLGLAPLVVERVLSVVTRAAADEGIALLLVEQYAHLALKAAERAYVLRLGQTTFAGPSKELADNPELLRDSYLGTGAPTEAGATR